MKNIIITVGILLIIGIGSYFVFQGGNKEEYKDTSKDAPELENENDTELGREQNENPVMTEKEWSRQSVIGQSVDGKNIVAYQYGTGETELLFVGGIHGGYSWNTAEVAYDLIDYIESNNDLVSENVQVTVIPALNPDGLGKVVNHESGFSASDVSGSESQKVAARFNGNDVDLNRNFDCEWQSNAKWQSRDVSGGSQVFSEPEAVAIKDYVNANNPEAVVVWYSAGGGVFSSSCRNGVSEETKNLTNLYAKASGYKAYESFDFYATTGDMVNWLAKEGVPAISVLLTTHESAEWNKNLNGIKALLDYYNQ